MTKAINNTRLEQTVVDRFIIEASLVDPVAKIVNQLNKREFRDCDVKWLDAKLQKFTEFACKTLGMDVKMMPVEIKGKILNDYTVSQYLQRFSTLLEYFKSL